ncbi:translation initiation factor if-2 [Nannochloropsis gaditana]|uniref:Translation initiation factor IF-2, chloroplastic n=2 Tax=Nannochloropsis gaditana TaxID=72520 RepID=W7T2T0_9STRA|nr:translation initiation factor if-2 [Nannochloropsis gaditana]
MVIPAVSPADLEAVEAARRKKEKEKLKKGGKYGEEERGGAIGKGGRGGGRKGGRFEGDVEDVDAVLGGGGSKYRKKGGRKGGRGGYEEPVAQGPKVVVLDEPTLTIAALSERMDVRAGEIIKYLMVNMGVMATITQSIDAETGVRVAEAFGRQVRRGREEDEGEGEDGEEELSVLTEGYGWEEEDAASLLPRAPVVTIMGHVDHGKTSLLDAVRESSVATGEAGGITQHIGAYQVTHAHRTITFIDTPGHAAFSEMRARGANVTDLVVLVVAADEGVKEQTIDSIRCAKQAHVPILLAVNKVDKPGADPSRVTQELMKYDVLLEEYGGDVLSAEVSAKKRLNLDGLLEKILLQAEILDLKANPNRSAVGAVVESRMEKGLGPVTTVLVQKGTLRVGDCIVAGAAYGKVRSLTDERGKRLETAGPSVPAVLSGWDGVPAAGDTLIVVESEMQARNVAEARRRLERERSGSATMGSMQAQVLSIFGTDGVKKRQEVTVVIKADVQGSAEAIATAVSAIHVEDDRAEVGVKVLSSGVGDVTQNDVALAGVSQATILAFNVAADMNAQEEARKTGVEIEYHTVIYDILDKLEAKVQEILSPTPEGEYVGAARVKMVFEIGKVGKVAGCEVTDGTIKRGGTVRVLRGSEIVYKGPLRTLRNVKSDVQEMSAGQECGMSFKDYEDFRPDDIVECYVVDKKK